ncbi:ROK family protein [Streptomyces sp. FXJ1.4098]|nr:ROK family protein [Streptomyces sp. FXJ1.4098]
MTAGPSAVLALVDELFGRLLKETRHEESDVLGVGLGVPGPVDFGTGRVVSPPIMTGWDRYDIPGWFAPRYDCPVLVDKDVNAMAYGEHRLRYPDTAHLLMVKIGTGVGTGIIAGGRIHRGRTARPGTWAISRSPSRMSPSPRCAAAETPAAWRPTPAAGPWSGTSGRPVTR